jgi:hypothetical protein
VQVFKSKFKGWDNVLAVDFTKSPASLSKNKQQKDAAKVDLSALFTERQAEMSEEKSKQYMQMCNDDLREMTCFVLDGKKLSKLPDEEIGVFFSGNCYVFVCNYKAAKDDNDEEAENEEEEDQTDTVVYFWEGREAPKTGWVTFKFSFQKKMEERKPDLQVFRMCQQQETLRFLAHFGGCIAIQRGKRRPAVLDMDDDDDDDDAGDDKDGDGDGSSHQLQITSRREFGNTVVCNRCNHSNKSEWTFCEECGSILSMQSNSGIPDYVDIKLENSKAAQNQRSHCRNMVSDAAAVSAKKTNTYMNVPYRRHWKQHWKCSSTTGPTDLQHGRSKSIFCWKQSQKRKNEPLGNSEINSLSCEEMPGITKGQPLIMKEMLSVSQSCLWTSHQHSTLPGSSLKLKTSVNIASSCISPIQQLPDELLLHIFSFLEPNDLAKCARVNKHFQRISEDSSLWKEITIVKRQLTDMWLYRLSELQPSILHLVCCRGGPKLSSSGLRQLFRSSAKTLHRLNISGCSGGELTGVSLLLHCSSRCHNLKSLNVSWCPIRNVVALKTVLEANQGYT